ncbi:hypothetical protein LguiA_034667 [Lonicera macranthoides]
MSRFRRFEIIEHPSPSLFLTETSIFHPKTLNPCFPSFPLEDDLSFALDLLSPNPFLPPLYEFDTITDLIQIEKTPFYTSARRVQRKKPGTELYLQSLCDRVAELELGFEKLAKSKASNGGDRKYTWTAEINGDKEGVDRKYKWVTEIKGGKKKEKSYKWTAEIKGKGEEAPISRTYTFKASTGNAGECAEKKENKDEQKKKKKSEKPVGKARLVEIQEYPDHGAVVLRQAFAKRAGASASAKNKGKKKELSPQDAAMLIQTSFRAYLIRRSQALRALRELAIAKTKLKDIRALFNNFTYRRRVTQDAEERQRFTEKIIVLLLTVDSIEGADLMVRSAKRSMVDELEAMLDVVDPPLQTGTQGRSLSMKRRMFDMPDGTIQKEIAAGVAQVVRMCQEPNDTEETSEASA